MTVCRSCGREEVAQANYCSACGAALEEQGSSPPARASVALLSFDVDGPTGLINRNPQVERMPSTFSMGEYGPAVAAPRILALLRKYEIRASFFIPGWIAERHGALVEQILREGHEVGHHGYLHEPPASLTPEQETEVLDRATAVLERLSGGPPLGYRSPSWELSPHSLDLLAARGFVYDSSLMGADRPYWVGPPERRLVEIPVHWSLDDYPYFAFSAVDRSRLMATPQHVYDVWASAFDELAARGDPFVLTMHPHQIGRAADCRCWNG